MLRMFSARTAPLALARIPCATATLISSGATRLPGSLDQTADCHGTVNVKFVARSHCKRQGAQRRPGRIVDSFRLARLLLQRLLRGAHRHVGLGCERNCLQGNQLAIGAKASSIAASQ